MGYSTRCKLAAVSAATVTAVAIVLIIVFTTMNYESNQPWETDSRLPFSVVPSRYEILLHPDLDEHSLTFGNFTGKVKIELEIKEDREWFVIHAKYLNIHNITLNSLKGSIDLNPPREVPKNEWWVIRPKKGSIPRDSYTFTVEFQGQLTRNIVGFYRSVYTRPDGEKRYIATTKFEPTYARLSFPCFDEPAMKATYKVRLVKPSSSEYIALSNSDVKSTTTDLNAKLTTVEFTETVKMSSYLAAFIVCDFVKQPKNVTMQSGKPVNVYARKEQISNTEEALKVALQVVEFYESYFNISYPMPKVDLIAIPDFVSGAMENWGLITFRETSILFDPNENSPVNQELISSTVAHELAHMWFGNLVTMKWWTDLWLNEGFATFMVQKSLADLHKDWDYGNQFIVSTVLSVLKLDAELSSHPVLQEVSHPDQITEIFDTISYNKGSSVILMLETFMGEDNFKKGLNTYLKTHQYGNAETADLWQALQDYAPANVDVAKIMNTWTLQMGFPLVTANRLSGKLHFRQKRFLSNKEAKYEPSTSKFGYKWEIPIFYSTSLSKENPLVWLNSDQESVEVPVDDSVQWVKINHNQKTYYRAMYDSKGWADLIKVLNQNHEDIDDIDRAGLISDAFSLADAGELEYETALNLTRYLLNEKKYVPWNAANTAISTLLQRLPESDDFKAYGKALVRPVVQKLGWKPEPDEPHLNRRLRALVLGLACSLKDEDSLSQANIQFADWLNGGNKPHQDIRSVIYKYGLGSNGSESLWNQLLLKFEAETNTQEKLKLMYALATTPNEELLLRYIDIAKNESIIRSQDYFTVLSYITDNPKGIQPVWDFYRNDYDYLVQRFSLNDRTFGRFITVIAAKFDTEQRKREVSDFFDKHPDAGAGAAARKQALEGISNKIKWLKVHKESVETWLQKHV